MPTRQLRHSRAHYRTHSPRQLKDSGIIESRVELLLQNLHLALICGIAPAVLIPVVSLLTPARGIADIHAGWLGLFVSLAIAGSVTNIVKGMCDYYFSVLVHCGDSRFGI